MIKLNILKNLAEKITNSLPEQMSTLKSDFSKNCESILKSAFTKLDLVTREEFDIQTKVLARTRAKLKELEKSLAEIENQQTHDHK